MALHSVDEKCTVLEHRLDELGNDRRAMEADSKDDHRLFLSLQADACNLLRAADPTGPEYAAILDRVNQTLNHGISLGYRRLQLEWMPSFAHSEAYAALEGPHRDKLVFSHRMKGPLLAMEKVYINHCKRTGMTAGGPLVPSRFPPPWSTTPRPHVLSTPLSRFETHMISPLPTSPLVRSIYEARCEVSSDAVNSATNFVVSGDCMLVPTMGGYKSRTPLLTYYLLNKPAADSGQDFPLDARHAEVGLTQIAFAAAVFDERKLMFVADEHRIKSYAWGDAATGEVYREARPTHTLHSAKSHGPLAFLPGGHCIRAGKGLVDVWNLDELETHGANGKTHTMRDEDDEIEDSAGSSPSTTLSLADPSLTPSIWSAHPTPGLPGTMLCGSDPLKSGDYSCVSVDLEHGGTTGARYLGGGGEIRQISTSSADPNVFLAAATDGYARLFDVRLPLPVLSLSAGCGKTACTAGVFVHPDGIPTVFTGTDQDEVLRLWDVRGAKLVYELSTGNNEVVGLAWDGARNVLYASTNCNYMDRNGDNHGYRKATIPKTRARRTAQSAARSDMDVGDGAVRMVGPDEYQGPDVDVDEEDDDDDDDYDDYPRCWPKDANHAEDYFGHIFDAGDYRIREYPPPKLIIADLGLMRVFTVRYAFKEQPNPIVLPIYGNATLGSSSYW
ncbi:hypothetical protein C8R43DRAFT_1234769 [Mycena crocata]|nr:hypothetical protein C8R43DRAFT_1234769 [Mycena crocata]